MVNTSNANKGASSSSSTSNNHHSDRSSNSSSTSLLTSVLVFVIALLLGILIQQNYPIFKQQPSVQFKSESELDDHQQQVLNRPRPTTDAPAPFDMQATFEEMSRQLKEDVLRAVRQELEHSNPSTPSPPPPPPTTTTSTVATKAESRKQDEVVNDPPSNVQTKPVDNKRVTVDEEMVQQNPDMKFKAGEPVVLKPEQVKVEKKEKKQSEPVKKPVESSSSSSSPVEQAKSFSSTKVSKMKPKKMWIPIPNSNGGHRRVPAIEINAGKQHGSSVKVWLYEEFLSKEECEQLIQVHDSHVAEMKKHKPIICFDSLETLRKNLVDLKRDKVAEAVTEADFSEGTLCINQTFSRQLEKWGLKWSYSTAFYPGESKFSTLFGKLIQEATQLEESHGGKFQITSYPQDVGYKSHTDCVVDAASSSKKEASVRDRYATFLVYLNDLGADGGGETTFSELGIDVRPREGRALTWNNMNYESGECEPKSIHEAAPVKHPVKKKYIIQRWYYYTNFYALGKRAQTPPQLPARPSNTPKVSCDLYDFGSCRMYDEWSMDHVIDYLNAITK